MYRSLELSFVQINQNMDKTISQQESFVIEFREKSYNCKPLTVNGRVLYQINFNSSYLYLTVASDFDGKPFWTSIPADNKLKHVVQVLGEQIKNYLK